MSEVSASEPLPRRALVVEDDVCSALAFGDVLELANIEVVFAHDQEEARERLATERFGVVFLDFQLGRARAHELYPHVAEHQPGCRAFLLTGHRLDHVLAKSLDEEPPSMAGSTSVSHVATAMLAGPHTTTLASSASPSFAAELEAELTGRGVPCVTLTDIEPHLDAVALGAVIIDRPRSALGHIHDLLALRARDVEAPRVIVLRPDRDGVDPSRPQQWARALDCFTKPVNPRVLLTIAEEAFNRP